MKHPPLTWNGSAFSLIELMAVIALIVLLMTLGGINLGTGGARLSTSGVHITGLMEQCRQAAILKRQPTALVMLSEGNDDVARRVFVVLSYEQEASGAGAGSWKRISRWEKLNKGILADTGVDTAGNSLKAFLPANSPIVDSPLPVLSYEGKDFEGRKGYGYVVFMPDGSLYQDSGGTLPEPFVVRLVEGVLEKEAIRYTGGKALSGVPANYFEISLNQATGLAKITRP